MKKVSKKTISTRRKVQSAPKSGAAQSKSQPASGPSLRKQYLKSSSVCKVTFRLPKEAVPDARVVSVVGDFNNWNLIENKMKRLKNGDFTATLSLPCNREYKFRYLIDSHRWENDWCADKYIPNNYGSDDSVVVIAGDGD